MISSAKGSNPRGGLKFNMFFGNKDLGLSEKDARRRKANLLEEKNKNNFYFKNPFWNS